MFTALYTRGDKSEKSRFLVYNQILESEIKNTLSEFLLVGELK